MTHLIITQHQKQDILSRKLNANGSLGSTSEYNRDKGLIATEWEVRRKEVIIRCPAFSVGLKEVGSEVKMEHVSQRS